MPTPINPELNPFHVLRYDDDHTGGRSLPATDRRHGQAGSAPMQVNGPGSVPGNVGVRQSRPAAEPPQTSAQQPVTPRDELEISTAGRMLDELNQSPELRAERLAQIKAAIDAGEYETPEKLEAALEKLLQKIISDSDGHES